MEIDHDGIRREEAGFKVDHLVAIGIEGENDIAHGTTFPYSFWKDGTPQEMIDYFNVHGNFVFYAHPYGSKIEPAELGQLKGLVGMEIFNSGCENILKCGISESYYDYLLWNGIPQKNGGVPWCFASDDAHLVSRDFLHGWIVVKAEELSRRAIVQAILDGSFYASRGPKIHDFYIEDDEAVLFCSPCREVYFISDNRCFLPVCAEENDGQITYAKFNFKGMEMPYLRVTCVGFDGKEAWSQPIVLKK